MEQTKKIHKWYLITTIILVTILILDPLFGIYVINLFPSFFIISHFIPILFVLIWGFISFVLLIFLKAKNYPITTLVVPLMVLLESLMLIFQPAGYWDYIILAFNFILLGVSLYFSWKK